MHNGEIGDYFDIAGDALKHCELKFESDGLFSVQNITGHKKFWIFSHARHAALCLFC